ncbi:hypothetical protein VTN77DRAFT_9868 [Rasamsonia byssochlamydoides]|uniref:uncharacterized protein n=1 Tax=Rasamsonia byssochlamydoides TaxID=89139 RepID=UPI003742E1C3
MSSRTPLSGRLSQIFSPQTFLLLTSIILSAGLFITATAPTLPVFLLGRVVTGCGSAGISSTTVILVLMLCSKKRRGLFLGLNAAGYMTGLATGAVLAGAVTPQFGWVGTYLLSYHIFIYGTGVDCYLATDLLPPSTTRARGRAIDLPGHTGSPEKITP